MPNRIYVAGGPKRIYVAGPSSDMERCRHAIREVREAGYAVTFDWVHGIEAIRGYTNTTSDAEVPEALGAWSAWRDLRAVKDADIVWLLLADKGRGAWVELGMAYSSDTFVITSGTAPGCVFNHRVDAHFPEDAAALAFLQFTSSLL